MKFTKMTADVDSHYQLAQILMKETHPPARIKELLSLAAASGSEQATKQLSLMYTGSDKFVVEEWAMLSKE